MRLRCGTRGSALALAQSDWVARRLRELRPGLELERVVIETSGDRSPSSPRAPRGPAPNLKALFVKEIEEALLAGTVDFAVHSGKDLPARLPGGLAIAAWPAREDPRDAYVGGALAPDWGSLPSGARVGSSSPRRMAQLRLLRPKALGVPLRGNVDTRLKRLEQGRVDGLLVAEAGLRRLGRSETRRQILPEDAMVPAPAQGALAVEARADRAELLDALRALDDAGTRLEVECERAFLLAMGGDCRSPLGAHARREGGRLRLRVFWSDGAASRPARVDAECPADPAAFPAFAAGLAARVRAAD